MNFPSFSHDLVNENQDGEIDDIVKRADGGSIGVLLPLKTDFVNIGADDFRRGKVGRRLHQIYLFKAQVHDISAVQYEQNHRRGNQHGNINVKNTLQLVGPIAIAASCSSGLTPESAAM